MHARSFVLTTNFKFTIFGAHSPERPESTKNNSYDKASTMKKMQSTAHVCANVLNSVKLRVINRLRALAQYDPTLSIKYQRSKRPQKQKTISPRRARFLFTDRSVYESLKLFCHAWHAFPTQSEPSAATPKLFHVGTCAE